MIVLTETATMSLNDTGVVPGVSLTTRGGWPFAVLHLTKGSRAIIAGNAVQGAGAGAVAFSGAVDAIKEPGDSTGDWEFNFIQLLYQPVQKFHYAGFDKSDGSMVLDVTEQIPQYRLDSDAARAPYPVTQAATVTALPRPATARRPKDIRDAPPDLRFSNNFEDHPNVANLFLVNKNYLTGADNYLIRAQVHRYFVTAFVVKDKLNRRFSGYLPLAYMTWKIIWDAAIWWQTTSKTANVMINRKEYTAEAAKKTYPPAEVAKLIETPTTNANEMFSQINFTQFSNAFNATANNRNCTASRGWPSDVAVVMVSYP
jgi:hypothetical protein